VTLQRALAVRLSCPCRASPSSGQWNEGCAAPNDRGGSTGCAHLADLRVGSRIAACELQHLVGVLFHWLVFCFGEFPRSVSGAAGRQLGLSSTTKPLKLSTIPNDFSLATEMNSLNTGHGLFSGVVEIVRGNEVTNARVQNDLLA
jgi:hypothetical protein